MKAMTMKDVVVRAAQLPLRLTVIRYIAGPTTHVPAQHLRALGAYHQACSCHHLTGMAQCLFVQTPHQT